MATTTSLKYAKPWTRIMSTNMANLWYYANEHASYTVVNATDLDGLAASADILQVAQLPPDIRLHAPGTRLFMGQYDSNAAPTATFSLVLTDGTTTYELIKDATIGRTATTGDFAEPGGRSADQLQGFLQLTDSTPWRIEIRLTAALATATTTNRWIHLDLPYFTYQ